MRPKVNKTFPLVQKEHHGRAQIDQPQAAMRNTNKTKADTTANTKKQNMTVLTQGCNTHQRSVPILYNRTTKKRRGSLKESLFELCNSGGTIAARSSTVWRTASRAANIRSKTLRNRCNHTKINKENTRAEEPQEELLQCFPR